MLNDDSLMSPPDTATSLDDFAEEESPLKEKKVEVNVDIKIRGAEPDGKRFTTKEKGKGKADMVSVVKSRVTGGTGVGAGEKENQTKVRSTRALSSSSSSGSVSSGLGSNPRVKAAAVSADGKKASKPAVKPVSSAATAGSTRVGMKLPPGKGGARRVPIDSAEAAPVGPGWRG